MSTPHIESTQSSEAGTNTAQQVHISMRGLPLLNRGATMDLLGRGEHMWAHSKVYSSGGENALHSHDTEDHLFLVLSGKALFSFQDESECEAMPFEGVFLRKGTRYKFRAVGEDNLVLIRVGAATVNNPHDVDETYQVPRELLKQRRAPDGNVANGSASANKTPSEPVEYKPGATFAP
jgi:mannose-6-phosphate isomerase-like protein (cupin superfamily)